MLFDFSKAFDTISPSKLIRKLQDMGFSRTALMWTEIYFTGYSQRFLSKSGESEYLETNLSVGPLLFSIPNKHKDFLRKISEFFKKFF